MEYGASNIAYRLLMCRVRVRVDAHLSLCLDGGHCDDSECGDSLIMTREGAEACPSWIEESRGTVVGAR